MQGRRVQTFHTPDTTDYLLKAYPGRGEESITPQPNKPPGNAQKQAESPCTRVIHTHELLRGW